MDNNNDKRSSTVKINANIANENESHSKNRGVGGRQKKLNTSTGGGGYLDTCTEPVFREKNFKNSEDPRIAELREIGLGHKWLQIAETIGFDSFMAMWSILDADNINNSGVTCERIRMWVPTFKRYLRFQRNRYILARASDDDACPKNIQKEIKGLLGESLSLTHIKRIMDKVSISE